MYITQVYLLAIFLGLIHMNKLKWTYLVQKKKRRNTRGEKNNLICITDICILIDIKKLSLVTPIYF